ncbi:MAG TPA: hypothetical protein VF297_06085 [Pyrinomonadaceae bacterium]
MTLRRSGGCASLGYRVEAVVKDLPCPTEQREDDPRERLYRMRQLSQGVEGLLKSEAADLNSLSCRA